MVKIKKLILISVIAICLFLIGLYLVNLNSSSASINESTQHVDTVLDKNTVMEIDINIDEANWEDLKANATAEEYYEADVTINGVTYNSVGIRTKGNSSLTSIAQDSTTDRYSFKLNFDKYIDDQTYNGIEKLALNNNYTDTTYMKEYLSYEIYSSLGVPTPEYAYANISINGEPWGLYLAVEDIDERYIEKYYGSVEGNLYKPETMDMNNMGMGQNGGNMIKPDFQNMPSMGDMPNFSNMPNMENMPNLEGGFNFQIPEGSVPEGLPEDFMSNGNGNGMGMPNMMGGNTGGADLKYIDDNIESYSTITESAEFKTTTEEDYQKIVDMIKNLNNGENLEQYLNVEEILKYFAVNTFLVNLDSYSGGMYHNYYLYERDGVFEILPWDLNMSFGGFGINSESSAVNFPIDSPVTGNLEDAPLIGKLLEVDSYKELYHSYLNTLMENYINNDGLVNLVDKIDSMINEYVKNDVTAFYTYEEYEKSLPALKAFIENRGASIIAQLNGEQPSTEYGTVEATFTFSDLGGMDDGKGLPGNNMDKFNNGAAMPQFPGNINGANIPQFPGNMNGTNMPQLPEGIDGNNMIQPPSTGN